ncbi:MAG: exodeoxyribonuclease V subunit gamma, partial [Actinomycetota bacterium]
MPGSGDNRLRTADAVADLFDRYAIHRPSMMEYWREGRATDGVDVGRSLRPDLHWQVTVYRRVCELIQEDTLADALAVFQRRVMAGDVPVGIPRRVNVVGFATLGPILRTLLDALAIVVPVEVFLLHPLKGSWNVGGSPVSVNELRPRHLKLPLDEVHPLTARWGRAAIETRFLASAEPVEVLDTTDRGTTLLGRLQSALTSRSSGTLASTETDSGKNALRHGDGTLQIHACHGRARQVEVLRDAFLHCLDADPKLYLDDILIVCPDIEAFAPLIPAIFRSDVVNTDSGPPPLRVRVAELDVTDDDPVVDAFMTVLQVARGRLGVAEVLGLLASPVVAHRFDLSVESVARLTDLADELHVVFGIDASHRAQWGIPAGLSEGTWRFALTRLMMGLAVAAPTPLIGPGDVVPFDDVSVTDVPVFGALAGFLEKFERLIEAINRTHTVGEWMGILQQVVDDFTRSSDSGSDRTQLLDTFDIIQADADEAGLDKAATFSIEEIFFVVRAHLVRRFRRPIFRSGEITVS